jgi:hypothetical protein
MFKTQYILMINMQWLDNTTVAYIGEGSSLVGYSPLPKCFKKLKNYFKHLLYFNGALCLFRICVQRQIVLGHL